MELTSPLNIAKNIAIKMKTIKARQQCRAYGLSYETEKAKFDHR